MRLFRSKKQWKIWMMLAIWLGVTLWGTKWHLASLGIEPGQSLEQFSQAWQERIPKLLEEFQIPGAGVALVVGGEPRWYGYFGSADIENNVLVSQHTLFQTGSIAKSVTSWGVLGLVEEGLVDLDSSLATSLTSWSWPLQPDMSQEITLRQLLTHTAGLGVGPIDQRYAPHDPAIPALRHSLAQNLTQGAAPGDGFLYSNTGFNLLELLIEDSTQKNFADYMREQVLESLGMESAGFVLAPDRLSLVAKGYDARHRPVDAYVYPELASGGLFATVADIARFTAAGSLHSSELRAGLSPDSIAKLYNPETTIPGVYGLVFSHYGLGHFLEYLDGHQLAVSHGGQGYGWMNHFHLIPETGDGVVILTNSQRSWPFFAALHPARTPGPASLDFGTQSRRCSFRNLRFSLLGLGGGQRRNWL